MNGIEDATLYAMVTLGAGVLGLLIKYGFKSKCSNVSCCFGLIEIVRDIKSEIVEQELGSHHENKAEGQDFSNV